MDKIKEKKLKAIKSDILEINEFVTLHSKNNNNKISTDYNTNINSNDTHLLTQIVGVENKIQNLSVFENIREEINTLKTMLIENEKLLKKILLKIK